MSRKSVSNFLAFAAAFTLFASCATAPAAPEWATPEGMQEAYPPAEFIALIGQGNTVDEARNTATAAIAQYFVSQVETSTRSFYQNLQKNGAQDETDLTTVDTLITSQVNLFAVRYADDPWKNSTSGQWETVAYINRDEAWQAFEPSLKQEADSYRKLYDTAMDDGEPLRKYYRLEWLRRGEATVRVLPLLEFAEKLNPKKAAVYGDVRSDIAGILAAQTEAASQVTVYIDMPGDYGGMAQAAFARALGENGFAQANAKTSASNTLRCDIDTARQKNSDFIFYTPTVQAVISGKTGELASYSFTMKRNGAADEDVLRRRVFTAMAGEIEQTFNQRLADNFAGK